MTVPAAQDFNLATHFDAELLEVSDDPRSAYDYCRQGLQWVQTEMAKSEAERDVQNLVNLMGNIAHQLKILQHLDDALQTIEAAVALVELNHLGPRQWAIQSLRLADVHRYRKEFTESRKLMEKVLQICESAEPAKDYKHFVLQHLGKLYFDQGENELALSFLQQALEIRKTQADASLILSTEMAIAATRARLESKSDRSS